MDQFDRRNEGEKGERSVEQMIRKLSTIDREFTDFKRSLGWDSEPRQWEEKALETVNKYIDTIRENIDIIDPESVFQNGDELYRLDPVFSVLLRAMKGGSIMTPNVFDSLRESWCHSDLPDDVDDLIRCQDDQTFVRKFENVELSDWGNIKLLALQKRGIRDLVEESQKKGQ